MAVRRQTIDACAEAEGMNRAEWLRAAVRRAVDLARKRGAK